jgi:hypothetical protein
MRHIASHVTGVTGVAASRHVTNPLGCDGVTACDAPLSSIALLTVGVVMGATAPLRPHGCDTIMNKGRFYMTSLEDILTEDIKRQRKIAEHALEKAKVFDDVMKKGNNDPLLKEAKEVLLYVARELAANTTITSSTAVDVIRKSTDDKR